MSKLEEEYMKLHRLGEKGTALVPGVLKGSFDTFLKLYKGRGMFRRNTEPLGP